MQRYEYSVSNIYHSETESIEAELKAAGAQGWELVTVENHRLYLRRQLPPESK